MHTTKETKKVSASPYPFEWSVCDNIFNIHPKNQDQRWLPNLSGDKGHKEGRNSSWRRGVLELLSSRQPSELCRMGEFRSGEKLSPLYPRTSSETLKHIDFMDDFLPPDVCAQYKREVVENARHAQLIQQMGKIHANMFSFSGGRFACLLFFNASFFNSFHDRKSLNTSYEVDFVDNHAPNAKVKIIFTAASRSIVAGEELTISYGIQSFFFCGIKLSPEERETLLHPPLLQKD